jgi:hypothetical protein
MHRQTQSAGQSHDAYIPEAQSSGSLTVPCVGSGDAFKERFLNGTALTDTQHGKHASIDLASRTLYLGQLSKPLRMSRSSASLMTVSMRRARPSLVFRIRNNKDRRAADYAECRCTAPDCSFGCSLILESNSA